MTAETIATRTTTWNIDAAHSVAEFSLKHLMISTVKGTFSKVSGTIQGDPNDPENISIDAIIDVSSITTNDEKRDAHLRSADFFEVEKYPTITFNSRKIIPVTDDTYQVIGELNLHGVTHEVNLDVTHEGTARDPWGNQRHGFTATTTLNRKDYGLNWNMALETGGVLVGDQVKVTLHIQAVGQVAA